eukprot:gene4837-5469_t
MKKSYKKLRVEQHEDDVCFICDLSNDLRTLSCGHSFCIDCLVSYQQIKDGQLLCPVDRRIEKIALKNLPLPIRFTGKLLFLEWRRWPRHLKILGDRQFRLRRFTIKFLREVAEAMKARKMRCCAVKIAGCAGSVAGGAVSIVGLSLSLTGVAAFVGVPLGYAGLSLVVASGTTTGVTMIVEDVLKKMDVAKIQRHLTEDYFRVEQIRILLARAENDVEFALKWEINQADALSFSSALPKIITAGLTTSVGARAVMGIAVEALRGAGAAGLHAVGIALAAAMIPVDLAQMIHNSLHLHKNKISPVVLEILEIADRLDTAHKVFLMNGDYFHLVHCLDSNKIPCWAYLIVYQSKRTEFLRIKNRNNITLESLEAWGEVVKHGKGYRVPDHVVKEIETEWYDLHLAFAVSVAENLNVEETQM